MIEICRTVIEVYTNELNMIKREKKVINKSLLTLC